MGPPSCVGADNQVAVVLPDEALRFVLAAPILADRVDKPGPLAGLVTGHARHGDAARAASAHADDRGDALAAPSPNGAWVLFEDGAGQSMTPPRVRICMSDSRDRPGDPFDATPARPSSRHCRRQRSTDRSETRNAAASSRFFSPASKPVTAWSRTCSRAALSASVKPPPCGYLTVPGLPTPPACCPTNSPTSPDQVQ
jgi:hypothetical protein